MKKILTSIIISALPLVAGAQEAMSFLTIPHDSRDIAVARTVTASTSMLDSDGITISGGHLSWMPNSTLPSRNWSATAGWSNQKLAVGMDFVQGSSPEMTITSIDGFGSETYRPSTLDAGLAAAFKPFHWLLFGADIHFAMDRSNPYSDSSAIYADFAASFRPVRQLTLHSGVMHIGQSITDISGQEFKLPASAFVSAEYQMQLSEYLSGWMYADGTMYLNGGYAAGVGASFLVFRHILLHAGYHYATVESPLPAFCAIGAGITFGGLKIEGYCMPGNGVIGGSTGVALTLNIF